MERLYFRYFINY